MLEEWFKEAIGRKRRNTAKIKKLEGGLSEVGRMESYRYFYARVARQITKCDGRAQEPRMWCILSPLALLWRLSIIDSTGNCRRWER